MLPEPDLIYGPLISPAFQPVREEGVSLDDLAVGAVVEVVTGHHTYRLESRGGGVVPGGAHVQVRVLQLLLDGRRAALRSGGGGY